MYGHETPGGDNQQRTAADGSEKCFGRLIAKEMNTQKQQQDGNPKCTEAEQSDEGAR